jgi:F0F1-type ATP synthase delta subunit
MVQKIQVDVRQQCEKQYNKKLTEMRNDLQEKHAKELETTVEAERKLMAEQFDEITAVLKRSAEEEQVCLTFHSSGEQNFPLHEI